jgi:Flp pilus assembly protein TadG
MQMQINHRRGSVIPLVAILMTLLFGFVALAIDFGILAMARTQCQNAADIAALAGARTLDGLSSDNNKPAAEAEAREAVRANTVLNVNLTDAQIATARAGVYRYNYNVNRFQTDFVGSPGTDEAWGAMQVAVQSAQPTYFAKLMGINSVNIGAVATAVHRPRDTAVVLDFSGSMGYGTSLNYLSGATMQSLNPDPNFPRFGPWSIYQGKVLDPNNPPVMAGGPSTYVPPTPMQRIFQFIDTTGEVWGPSNMTMATDQGPAVVNDFVLSDNSTRAFVRSGNFPTLSNVNVSGATFPNTIITPAPDTFADQSTSNFVGDKFPLRSGATPSGTPAVSDYAQTVADYLGVARSAISDSSRSISFETYGYDWDYSNSSLKSDNRRYQGFTMGPGYFGKTFYYWPPDPRTPVGKIGDATYVAGDWRQRFFLARSGSGLSTQDNSIFWSTTTGRWKTQSPGSFANYIVNYAKVLEWLRTGPQTLPKSLRAGRVVYFDSMPTDIPIDFATGVILTSATPDQRFWKDYIDFVLGAGRWTDGNVLYGANSSNSCLNTNYNNPESTALTTKITPRATLKGTPKPYMRYDDNPVHPRAQFWFGPLSMLAYLRQPGNWLPGTAYETQAWQLKAGINSAMDDIKKNHPNDMASLIYFSSSAGYADAIVDMSRQYNRIQKALFYPRSLLDSLGDTTSAIRPYTSTPPGNVNPSGIMDQSDTLIPNAGSGTCPEMGLKVAFNQLSSASSPGKQFRGRRGASKVVIFETDGVPNFTASGSLVSTGTGGAGMWYYDSPGTTSWVGTSTSLNATPKSRARDVVKQITALDTASSPGYSTLRNPARVHALGFGYIFESTSDSDMRKAAIEFLYAVQVDGKTSPAPSSAGWDGGALGSIDTSPYSGAESYKLITGTYNQRIEKLRQAMERITQAGVTVVLIQ